MNKWIKLSLVTALALSTTAFANEDVKTPKEVKNLTEMFSEGEVSGQIRLGYATNKVKTAGDKDTYATAAGGQLKYETASLMGVSLGAAMYTSHSVDTLSGKDAKYNDEMASSQKSYTELAEAYLNFSYEGFEFRGGRQLIDTPLADSDDIRMTPHTFEAYIASYTFKELGLAFIAGNILSWQGVDSDYSNAVNNSWAKTGEDGTRLGAVTYADHFLEASVWYYDVTKETTAVYLDAVGTIDITDDISVAIAAQYLTEDEKESSYIEGNIVGAMVEAGFYDVTATAAFDKVSVKDGKSIFEGFGGGASYTNLDTMTAGTLHDGTYGDGSSYMLGLAYEIAGFNIFGAYGDYKADAITVGNKAHVTEVNLGLECEYNDGEADATIIYVIGKDKESATKTEFDNDRIQVVLNYNF
ncbi:hypothetical protein M947_08755 [Sulfurimonas hongkongensis]|uniref:Porin n=1 Tax=Sulfurimonas hongkongensis TaxID=1172190 RepID=T0JEW4_9BACT|nr:OprD family outer membrane porin [Sulfurimonas hongkongensis]EQB35362.1 hypothetical protein M947_08755 [Sulfurimonas hongkongensis]